MFVVKTYLINLKNEDMTINCNYQGNNFSFKFKKSIGIIEVSKKEDLIMHIFRVALFILVSIILTTIELTVDPSFYGGRIFLGVSAVSMVILAVSFIMENWRLQPAEIKK